MIMRKLSLGTIKRKNVNSETDNSFQGTEGTIANFRYVHSYIKVANRDSETRSKNLNVDYRTRSGRLVQPRAILDL